MPSGTWRTLEAELQEEPLDASEANLLHGVFGVVFEQQGERKIMAAGGGNEAWIAPISKVHIFTPPDSCGD